MDKDTYKIPPKCPYGRSPDRVEWCRAPARPKSHTISFFFPDASRCVPFTDMCPRWGISRLGRWALSDAAALKEAEEMPTTPPSKAESRGGLLSSGRNLLAHQAPTRYLKKNKNVRVQSKLWESFRIYDVRVAFLFYPPALISREKKGLTRLFWFI